MCGTCGCGEQPKTKSTTIALEHAILANNSMIAARNRGWFADRGVTAVNLMASPGAGKTTLLERTLAESGLPISVIEGDQATSNDADRIRAAGARAVQINTGTGCHLEAKMVATALGELDPPRDSIVVIENVGNLVCPALFDLGEHARVLVASTTEGDDKPLKYPHMFHAASVILLNKIDLLPYIKFDVDAFAANVRRVTHDARVIHVSATRGDGLADFYAYVKGIRA